MTVYGPSILFETDKWLGHSLEIRREELVFFSRRAINALSHVTLNTPINPSLVKVRPGSLVRSAYLLVAALQTCVVVM